MVNSDLEKALQGSDSDSDFSVVRDSAPRSAPRTPRPDSCQTANGSTHQRSESATSNRTATVEVVELDETTNTDYSRHNTFSTGSALITIHPNYLSDIYGYLFIYCSICQLNNINISASKCE